MSTKLFGKAGLEMMPMLNGAAGRIDEMRQRYDIPLTPIGDANMSANSPFGRGQNEGLVAVPPSTVETFVPRLPMAVTKEMREHMVRALEGTFVPYNRGEVALRALGLVPGEMSCYVEWLAGLGQLAAMTLFLLGRVCFVLDEEEVVNGSLRTGDKVKFFSTGNEYEA